MLNIHLQIFRQLPPELSVIASQESFVLREMLGPVICDRYHHTYSVSVLHDLL